ncbi:MAG TPA: threonine synthase [Sulfurihydrogenibium sp.]|uniref:threonine synthase n=1 Tax=Sulfurihydrogenibium sp. (strain YO3AOP1) TaxID=436114 RepID=UPI0001724D78|nr:threonine synthase [Sulfurihydrogenibium sp. YO3AOP1]ACD66022.1 threonine synthase [Sulfurihydrogenibium sp. YO3AOP1]HBT98404.1 threonine synthase [Sulfurihydrogenibium sp.]
MGCKWKGIIEAYRQYLPVNENTPIITLHEGNTPLIKADNLSKEIAPNLNLQIYLKYEGLNPTGSFKDRGMTMAISKAKENGKEAVICASTGNTSASAAAYAAKAGMRAYVLLPKGAVAIGKLSQAMVYGAKIIAVMGNFDDALEIVREIGEKYPVEVVNSVNPYRIEGQKTAAFEICDYLEEAPDFHFIPVGNAGNITAYWKGYKEYHQLGKVKKLPRMIGWQAEGAAPIVKGFPIKNPQTIATAIKIGNPYSWQPALQAARESNGFIDAVSDDEILYAYKLVASTEGVFCEPASAASVAGVIKSVKKGLFKGGEVITCTLTGNGLKDPDTVIKASEKPVELPPNLEEIARFLELI